MYCITFLSLRNRKFWKSDIHTFSTPNNFRKQNFPAVLKRRNRLVKKSHQTIGCIQTIFQDAIILDHCFTTLKKFLTKFFFTPRSIVCCKSSVADIISILKSFSFIKYL